MAAAFASRRADDRWFCWERPGRGRLAIGAIGSTVELISRGEDRFADLLADAARISSARLGAEPKGGMPTAAGPLWVGGFAFDPDGGGTPPWSSLPPAMMAVPEVLMRRDDEGSMLTLTAMAGAGRDPEEISSRAAARLAGVRVEPLPPIDPDPVAGVSVESARSPADYERAVAEGVKQIRAGGMRKIVLSREVVVDAHAAHDVAALFGALRELFDSCFCFCVGSPEAAFVGASPELLVRRAGATAATVALAGSARRSADPSVDDHLGEQLRASPKDRDEHRIVVERIRRKLAPAAVWLDSPDEPSVVKVANIQHLATPIRAQLADPPSVLGLAAMLHPTPAVGGEPGGPDAQRRIRELERMDRGWYAGPVGWMDMAEDGEFCVALRSALIRDRRAHLYAGAGIVADSDPAAELAETEVKLGALLPLLAG
ncbi:MAG: isochorismate synthase [Solirubrobacterales bacterium]